ncbi:SurA N-terminal domain-containing protein [Caldimonas brevitalea]|uniref:Periplasmic chaperone PpiD n=1 Tax=Caldimonas brevitalea TaxID=413882 RepID=A0A0G3BMX0_9BURK|nr:SurA N-terminal domain-containing protein [Caldimonas brevitalea]AKJ28746.1 peptidylprolyl isomerase [Caldimonas brevitalea]
MFDFVRNNTRILFFVLLLLIIPSFVFFGVEGYSQFREGAKTVAEVAGQDITEAELEAAHRNQVERMRAQMPGIDSKMFDTPEMRRQTLEALVRERVMLTAADKQHLVTSDERLQRIFATDPQLAFLRKPDGTLNRDILAAQGMSPQGFEQRLRQDLSLRQVMLGVSDSTMASKTVTETALDAFMQQRDVQVARFEAKDYLAKVNPTDADLEAYYKDPKNVAQFQTQEQVKIEYVVLDLESVKKGITVPEDELRNYYKENEARYSTPEERRASHILIKADKGAPAAQRDAAKAKAEKLLAELKQNPDRFAELAKQNSEDPGSAANGGDLEFFGRGAMVKPFEEAAFTLKQGEISPVVETDFGFHIIRVTGARGGDKKSFEAVKAEIEDEVRTQQAQKRYAEVAEQFSNMVYEQTDALKPVADKLQLPLQTADKVTRTPGPGAQGVLANPKLLAALFTTEAISSKRNTEALEVAPSQLVAARVVEHQPARTLPLEEVKPRVREALVARQAAEMARKEGEAKLAAWQKAPAEANLPPAVKVSRLQPGGQSREVVEAALKAKTDKLPSWVGVDLGPQGYAVVRINSVAGRAEVPAADQLPRQYAQAWGAAEAQAYYEALKKRYKTEITYDPKAAPAP